MGQDGNDEPFCEDCGVKLPPAPEDEDPTVLVLGRLCDNCEVLRLLAKAIQDHFTGGNDFKLVPARDFPGPGYSIGEGELGAHLIGELEDREIDILVVLTAKDKP